MIIAGNEAVVKVGFQRSATLRRWTLTHSKETLGEAVSDVDGIVVTSDTYWSTQPPTEIGLWMGKAWWVWRRVEAVEAVPSAGKLAEFRVVGNPEIVIHF